MKRRLFLQSIGGAAMALPFLQIQLPAISSSISIEPSKPLDYILNEEWRIAFTGFKTDMNGIIYTGSWLAHPMNGTKLDFTRLSHYQMMSIEKETYFNDSARKLVVDDGYNCIMKMLKLYEEDKIPRVNGEIDSELVAMQEKLKGNYYPVRTTKESVYELKRKQQIAEAIKRIESNKRKLEYKFGGY